MSGPFFNGLLESVAQTVMALAPLRARRPVTSASISASLISSKRTTDHPRMLPEQRAARRRAVACRSPENQGLPRPRVRGRPDRCAGRNRAPSVRIVDLMHGCWTTAAGTPWLCNRVITCAWPCACVSTRQCLVDRFARLTPPLDGLILPRAHPFGSTIAPSRACHSTLLRTLITHHSSSRRRGRPPTACRGRSGCPGDARAGCEAFLDEQVREQLDQHLELCHPHMRAAAVPPRRSSAATTLSAPGDRRGDRDECSSSPRLSSCG